jgi:hypothetical protein
VRSVLTTLVGELVIPAAPEAETSTNHRATESPGVHRVGDTPHEVDQRIADPKSG